MTPIVANESELYFERGGPAYRLMQRIGLIRGEGPSVRRRVVAFLLITWVPLLFFSLLEGRAYGPTPRESFVLDFAAYARFLLAVPLLVVAEVVVGPRLTGAGLRLLRAGLVRPEEYPAFEKAIARVVRWRESLWPELIILGIALVGAWTLTSATLTGGETATWHTVSTENGLHFSLTAFWYRLIAVPLVQFFFYRWLWRLVIWTRFLGAVSRLDLDLVPTHADQAGGLGFLGTAHVTLGIFAGAASCILCAEAGFRIVFDGAPIETFRGPFVGVLIATEVVCLGPLLVFMPIMMRKRRQALREYGLLVLRYNREFHEKWVTGKAPDGEPLLGSADIQSLADLGGSFEFIRSMKTFPFSFRTMIQLAAVAVLPTIPLLPLAMPWSDILEFLAKAAF